MSDIRHYIAIVEGFLGRKSLPPPSGPEVDPAKHNRLSRAKTMHYRDAQAYAKDNCPREVRNTDPPHLKASIQQEYDALVAEWDRWHRLGYF